MLSVRGLSVTVEGRRLLDGVDVEVAAGEVVGLVGPNGAGKSTLLRAATGVRAAQGEVALAGRPLASYRNGSLFRTVAVVQQMPEAPDAMTVQELVLLGRHPHLGLLRREGPRDHAIALASMQRVGCEAFAQRMLGTLSGGERRRAFIARALAQQPRLLLLDEPTSGLDADAQAQILALLRALAAEGVAVLVVVHDLTFAAAYCDRLVLMQQGRVVASGAPAQVVTQEHVRAVYGPHVRVIPHPESGAPLVVPAVS
ncbi:MAG: ABC transporter ATP-binding protein [Dehalococcoidia bacterium]|nr:ABC transporter ATP-binding protein [Dehalococcoidia bacterium]